MTKMFKIEYAGMKFEAPTLEECVQMAQLFAVGKTQSKQGTGAKAPATKQAAAKEPKAPKLFSTEVKDYEPKRGQDGEYVWASYKAQRSHYCYAVATKGHCKDNPYGSAWAEAGNAVDYSPEGLYYTAKKQFEEAYKYIPKAQR